MAKLVGHFEQPQSNNYGSSGAFCFQHFNTEKSSSVSAHLDKIEWYNCA